MGVPRMGPQKGPHRGPQGHPQGLPKGAPLWGPKGPWSSNKPGADLKKVDFPLSGSLFC